MVTVITLNKRGYHHFHVIQVVLYHATRPCCKLTVCVLVFWPVFSRNNVSQESSWLNKDQINKQILTHHTAATGCVLLLLYLLHAAALAVSIDFLHTSSFCSSFFVTIHAHGTFCLVHSVYLVLHSVDVPLFGFAIYSPLGIIVLRTDTPTAAQTQRGAPPGAEAEFLQNINT